MNLSRVFSFMDATQWLNHEDELFRSLPEAVAWCFVIGFLLSYVWIGFSILILVGTFLLLTYISYQLMKYNLLGSHLK